MDKYFNGEEFTLEEIKAGLHKGVVSGDVVPVIVGSAIQGIGVHTLFKMISDYMPTPTEMFNGERVGTNPVTGEPEVRKISKDELSQQ